MDMELDMMSSSPINRGNLVFLKFFIQAILGSTLGSSMSIKLVSICNMINALPDKEQAVYQCILKIK